MCPGLSEQSDLILHNKSNLTYSVSIGILNNFPRKQDQHWLIRNPVGNAVFYTVSLSTALPKKSYCIGNLYPLEISILYAEIFLCSTQKSNTKFSLHNLGTHWFEPIVHPSLAQKKIL